MAVTITHWDPADESDLESLPADLRTKPAAAGGSPGHVVSAAMSSLSVVQGEVELRVADGAAVTWEVVVSEERRELLGGHDVILYGLDEGAALWEQIGTGHYEPDTGVATFEAPALWLVSVAQPL